MDLTGLEVSYSWPLVKDTVVSIAPTLEFVDAKARIASRRFSDTEVRPGARAVVRYYLRDHLNLAIGYRYSSATGRDFHQIQATVGFEFR